VQLQETATAAVADAAAENRYAEPDTITSASAKEVDSHLRLLAGAGAVQRTAAGDILMVFDEVRAMLWRLINPRTG
jgi:hypothetical protein